MISGHRLGLVEARAVMGERVVRVSPVIHAQAAVTYTLHARKHNVLAQHGGVGG